MCCKSNSLDGRFVAGAPGVVSLFLAADALPVTATDARRNSARKEVQNVFYDIRVSLWPSPQTHSTQRTKWYQRAPLATLMLFSHLSFSFFSRLARERNRNALESTEPCKEQDCDLIHRWHGAAHLLRTTACWRVWSRPSTFVLLPMWISSDLVSWCVWWWCEVWNPEKISERLRSLPNSATQKTRHNIHMSQAQSYVDEQLTFLKHLVQMF